MGSTGARLRRLRPVNVVFAVDDLRFKANLGARGSATIVLPRLTVGGD